MLQEKHNNEFCALRNNMVQGQLVHIGATGPHIISAALQHFSLFVLLRKRRSDSSALG